VISPGRPSDLPLPRQDGVVRRERGAPSPRKTPSLLVLLTAALAVGCRSSPSGPLPDAGTPEAWAAWMKACAPDSFLAFHGWLYVDARKCYVGVDFIPMCLHRAKPKVERGEWLCAVGPDEKLYVTSIINDSVPHGPGWTFGPASYSEGQPAFKSSLSAKDEARCAEAMLVRTTDNVPEGSPRLCVGP
jgi:hypothetical protein